MSLIDRQQAEFNTTPPFHNQYFNEIKVALIGLRTFHLFKSSETLVKSIV